MSARVCLIDLPGMSRELLASVPAETAFGRWMARRPAGPLAATWPAVTCSVQATLTTGVPPSAHGIVANGLPTFLSTADQAMVDASNFASYRKQISFWEQSNQFVQAPRFWQDSAGNSKFKTALLFFQNSMPGFAGALKPAADIVLTPKPDHGPDGKLTSLCWSNPPELVPMVFRELGPFPLMNYWGPIAGIASSAWIAKAAGMIWREYQPQLQLVYVPHLDYDLQRFGPDSPQAKRAVVDLALALDPLFYAIEATGGKIVVLSEYALSPVSRSVAPNKLLKAAGLLKTVSTPDGQLIDYQNSDALALVDHQIAHVYLNSSADLEKAKSALMDEGIEILQPAVSNPRAGQIQLQARPGSWFDYRWWDGAADAPPFASTVDIHRKPGYDPLELFLEPGTRSTTQNASLIRGSHGAVPGSSGVIIGDEVRGQPVEMTSVAAHVLSLMHSE